MVMSVVIRLPKPTTVVVVAMVMGCARCDTAVRSALRRSCPSRRSAWYSAMMWMSSGSPIAISEALVELPVEQAEIRENVDRRGPAGRRDEVAGNDPMPEGVVSNSPEVGWSRGNLRRYQEIGVEEVPPATEVADGRETVDPPDSLDPLESIL